MGVGEQRTARRIQTVGDARRLARRRVPAVVFDYIDGAAESERTMRSNEKALAAIDFVPQMAVTSGTPGPDLTTTVLGASLAMPVIVAPVGFTRSMDPAGDVAGARAAAAAGTVFTLSSMSGHPMEEVAASYRDRAGEQGAAWFQLYALGGRRGAEQLVERAQEAGYTTLVVTVDTQIVGSRERDLRHGASIPLRLDSRTMLRFAPKVVAHPRWLFDAARDRFRFEIVHAASLGTPDHPLSTDDALIQWVLSPVTWDDFDWIRRRWSGPVVAKGVLTAADAHRAIESGATGVVVSNHGGRQLDGAPATMPALVDVVDAVGDRTEVLVDGGIRRGSDVVRAMALGARAVMVGRPWVYGLAAAGEPGVSRVLSILRTGIDRTLRLMGCPSVRALDRHWVRVHDAR
ncbi:MAG: alpha-hydroxy acid oxidase [Acidimicrobiales bacterium]